jgi:hypothetical protein
MARLAVRTAKTRLLLRGLAGLVLLLAAADVLWLHVVASPPETGADGVLTARGANSRRLDIVWGSSLGIGGGALLAWSATGLVRRAELVVVGPDGMEMRLHGEGAPATFVPWDRIRSVRSTVYRDETGSTPALEVVFDDPDGLPVHPSGAAWDGDRLLLDAEGWDIRAVDVSVIARLALDRAHRPPDGEATDEEVPYP